MLIHLKLLFLLFMLQSKSAHGFGGIVEKYKEIIGSIGISFGKADLQCFKHMSTLSAETATDGIKTGLSLLTDDKARLKSMFGSEEKRESSDHLFYKNGSCYFVSTSDQIKSQHAARSYCQAIGTNNLSRLYEFKNTEEYEYLFNKTLSLVNKQPRKYGSFYLGLEKVTGADEVKQVKWISGGSLSSLEESTVFFNKKINLGDTWEDCFALTMQKLGDKEIVNEIRPANCEEPKRFICRFEVDYCEGHDACGANGFCKSNVKAGSFECKCHIFYQGQFCHEWSYQGIQIVICFGLILIAILSIIVSKQVRNILDYCTQSADDNLESENARYSVSPLRENKLNSAYLIENFNYGLFDSLFRFIRKKPKVFVLLVTSLVMTFTLIVLKESLKQLLGRTTPSTRLVGILHSFHSDLCSLKNNFLVENYVFIIFSLPLTVFLYFWNSFHLERRRVKSSGKEDVESPEKIRLSCRLDFRLLVPMNPFAKNNRFVTCIIYAAYVHNISKIFFEFSPSDYALDRSNYTSQFNSSNTTTANLDFRQVIHSLHTFQSLNINGILVDLLLKVLNVFIIGFHFYPVLLCVEFKRRSKLSYLLCSLYVWLLFAYYVFVNEMCRREDSDLSQVAKNLIASASSLVKEAGIQNNLNFSSLALSISSFKNRTKVYKIAEKLQNLTANVTLKKNLVERSTENFNLEELVFYFILCLIAVNLTVDYVVTVLNQILSLNSQLNICGLFNARKVDVVSKTVDYESETDYEIARVKNELNYTVHIFKQSNSKVSYLRAKFESYVYRKHPYFRFSKQFLNTHVIAFILIYYVTFFIIRRAEMLSYVVTYSVAVVLNLVFKKFLTDENIVKIVGEIGYQVSDIMIKTCVLTTSIYVVQLICGIKQYQKQVLQAYRGVYNDIPSPKKYSNATMTSGSLHYSGYAIGFLVMGYGILSVVNFLLVIIIKVLINFPLLKLDILKYVLPILTIFFFKRILIWYLCRFVLTHRSGKTLRLKNTRLYLIVNHFNFFFDSFIIFFIAIMRVFYSLLATLFFMPRLDYSVFGLFLERFDMGFMSYISFLHMEVNQTHPVKLAFCELVKRYAHSEDYQSLSKEKKLARNQWNLAYTLFRNPYLKRERKTFVKEQSIYHKERKETLKQCINRKARNITRVFRRKKNTNLGADFELRYEKKITNDESMNTMPFSEIVYKKQDTPVLAETLFVDEQVNDASAIYEEVDERLKESEAPGEEPIYFEAWQSRAID